MTTTRHPAPRRRTRVSPHRPSAPRRRDPHPPRPATARRRSRRAVLPAELAHRAGRRRLGLLLVVLSLLFASVVARLVQLQVIAPERYVALGESQRVRPIDLPADRGAVFDRNGTELAMSVTQKTVWADPRLVADPRTASLALAPIVGIEAPALQAKLSSAGAFQYVARQVSDDVAAQVEALKLSGIYLLDEPRRFNPNGDLGRSFLGSVNLDNVGRAGLELQFEDLLSGTPGEVVLERDPDGRTIASGQHRVRPPTPGDDLVLTIDRAVQYQTERALSAQVEAAGARGGMAIVTDPRTGEILALANIEKPADGGPPRPSGNNMALTTVFEPGSVNKVITLAGALEEGIARPQTKLAVPDKLPVADHVFTDHDPHPTQDYTLTDIMTTSSNVGTIMLGQELGPDRLDHYLRAFGFGVATDLEFPNESAGLLLPLDNWSGTSIGSIPLGQGIAVTAMQMLSAFNVIANEGVYVSPKIVQATIDADGDVHETADAEQHRVVSERTADEVRDMMVQVVQVGTGQKAAIAGYDVAGKTGTARKPQATGGYRDAAGHFHYVATFAGFVPAEDPKLSVIVVLDEPVNGFYASQLAAPVFAEIAAYGLRQLRIPPYVGPLRTSVPLASVGIVDDTRAPGRVRQQAAVAPPPPPPPVAPPATVLATAGG